MKLSIGTAGPPFVVLATSLGLLYFYLDPPPGPAAPRPIGLEVTEAMLSPNLEPLPARNPFRLARDVEEKSKGFASVPANGVKVGPAEKGEVQSDPKPAKEPAAPPSIKVDAFTTRLRQWAESVNKRADHAKLIQADLKTKVEGKANLSATSINARSKIAIINGRAYAEGEAIEWASGMAGPIVVAEIRAASVMLRTQGARLEVLFPHSSRPTAAAPTVAANVSKKPKAARKSAGTPATKPR